MKIALHHSKQREKSLLASALAALVTLFAITTVVNAASSGEVQVFASADDASPVIESVSDGRSLALVAEMTGAGGVKWFMVKTKSGNVGWIKAGDVSAAKIDDHFRALPKDSGFVAPSVTAEPASSASAAGAITIPVRIDGAKVVVPVTFKSGYNSSTGYLAVDTGAAQTMVSRRIARELRLLSAGGQKRVGIGGVVTVDVGVVEAVRVGRAEVKNMPVSIHDRVMDLGYEGLLGFDFLGRFQMSVDADKQVMVLTPRGK